MYGWITTQQVKSRKLELYNMPFGLYLPVDFIFNAVNNMMELSDQARIPMVDDQYVKLAYVIFAPTHPPTGPSRMAQKTRY